MSKSMQVRQLAKEWRDECYDLAIVSVGYERRARYVAETLTPRASKKVAYAFLRQQELEYQRNAEIMSKLGYSVELKPELAIGACLREELDALVGPSLQVLVDVSSMTRVRIATILLAVEACKIDYVKVRFVYSLASFSPPPASSVPNSHVGPVCPEFAGWWPEPDRGLTAVVGLGYEEDKALGAVEHLQAGSVWTFTPQSPIGKYSDELMRANRTLLEGVDVRRQLTYRVQDPFECFCRLESLVFGLSQSSNVVLLPFGPKIFSLCSFLVGRIHPSVPVWRVSADGNEPAVNRVANGAVYGLEVELGNGVRSE